MGWLVKFVVATLKNSIQEGRIALPPRGDKIPLSAVSFSSHTHGKDPGKISGGCA
jgi:hypothetical protein